MDIEQKQAIRDFMITILTMSPNNNWGKPEEKLLDKMIQTYESKISNTKR